MLMAKKQVWLGGIWGHKWCYLGHLFLGLNPKSQGFLGSPGYVGFSGAHFGWPTSTCFDLVQHKRL